jgi:hypothetical protein
MSYAGTDEAFGAPATYASHTENDHSGVGDAMGCFFSQQ